MMMTDSQTLDEMSLSLACTPNRGVEIADLTRNGSASAMVPFAHRIAQLHQFMERLGGAERGPAGGLFKHYWEGWRVVFACVGGG